MYAFQNQDSLIYFLFEVNFFSDKRGLGEEDLQFQAIEKRANSGRNTESDTIHLQTRSTRSFKDILFVGDTLFKVDS
jgi:hypothetical protein